MSSVERDVKKNCTFIPSMSKKSQEMMKDRSKRDLSVQKKSKGEQIKLQKIKQDWEEMKECTFKPETNVLDKRENPQTIHRLYRLHREKTLKLEKKKEEGKKKEL